MTTASNSGNHPPSNSLSDVRAQKKIRSMTRKKPFTARRQRVEAPLQRDERRQQGRDHHQQRDRDAVSAGERLEEPKPITAPSVAAPSSQFTSGT